jgi:hypothetical protein
MGNRGVIAIVMLGLAGPVVAQPEQGPLVTRSMSVTPYTGQTVRVAVLANSCTNSPVGFIVDNVVVSGGSSVTNGSFESGLTGWTEFEDSCDIYSAGAGDPIGYEGDNTAPTPTNGTALAASSAGAPGICGLSQDVAITGAGTLSADVGWTISRFQPQNPNCVVTLRLEDPDDSSLLDEVVVFDGSAPASSSVPVPATPLWALGLLSGLLAVFGWRRIKKS